MTCSRRWQMAGRVSRVPLALGLVSRILFGSIGLSVFIAPWLAYAAPYGPSGTLGPAGAPARTCDGLARCSVVSPSDAWQAAIEGADAGDMILLRAGTYDAGGTIDIPAGSALALVTVANYDAAAVTINGGLTVGSHVLVEGISINRGSGGSYAIEVDRRTATPKQNVILRHLDVLGGTIDALRIRGNIQDTTIADSLLDGGRGGHVIKVRCDDNSNIMGGSCNWLPAVTIMNNRLSKVRAFPGSSSEDLIQFDGAGDVVVTRNEFGDNPNGEDCLDWKPQGADGTSIQVSHNLFGNCGGVLFQQERANGSTVIDGNRFAGGGSLLRQVHAGTRVINNVISGDLTVSASNFTLGYNTFTGPLKFGDTTQGAPQGLEIVNNIFAGTRFSCSSVGCGSYSATRNVIYQTSGSFNCQSCIPTDPLLSDYEIGQGSSGQDQGSSGFLVAVDIEGTKRPQGAAPDIGAFELVGGAPPPPPTASLSANPAEIEQGQSSTLTWESANASACEGTGLQTDGATSGQATVSPTATTTYEVDCDGALGSATVTVNQALPPDDTPPPDQQPFAANAVPGIIEGEDYDLGGEGVAYHDTDSGNNGGEYRADDVDIKANTYDSGHTVGWGASGEWLEWTVTVEETADYRVSAYIGTDDTTSPRFTLSIDGTPRANVSVPNSGSWDVRQYVEAAVVPLTSGSHLMRVDIEQGGVDIDHFELVVATAPPPDDVTPPYVAIVEPADGAGVPRRSSTLVRVDASDDDAGIDTVTLRIEGQVVATFSGAGGHEYSWRPAGKRNRPAVLEATALDLAGNTSSDSITVIVAPRR